MHKRRRFVGDPIWKGQVLKGWKERYGVWHGDDQEVSDRRQLHAKRLFGLSGVSLQGGRREQALTTQSTGQEPLCSSCGEEVLHWGGAQEPSAPRPDVYPHRPETSLGLRSLRVQVSSVDRPNDEESCSRALLWAIWHTTLRDTITW